MQLTRILIVEDEGLLAEELRDNLDMIGHSVIGVAATAEDAVATALQEVPGLILMDVRLRGKGDGIDAAARIVERIDVPIIFMTAHSDAETVERAMRTRSFGYMVKPVREDDLNTAIQTGLLRFSEDAKARILTS